MTFDSDLEPARELKMTTMVTDVTSRAEPTNCTAESMMCNTSQLTTTAVTGDANSHTEASHAVVDRNPL